MRKKSLTIFLFLGLTNIAVSQSYDLGLRTIFVGKSGNEFENLPEGSGSKGVIGGTQYEGDMFALIELDSTKSTFLIGMVGYRYSNSNNSSENPSSTGPTVFIDNSSIQRGLSISVGLGRELNRLSKTRISFEYGIVASFGMTFLDSRKRNQTNASFGSQTADFSYSMTGPPTYKFTVTGYTAVNYYLSRRLYVGMRLNNDLNYIRNKGDSESTEIYTNPTSGTILSNETTTTYFEKSNELKSAFIQPSLTLGVRFGK